MEDRYDELTRVLSGLDEAVNKYKDFKDELEVLKDYMDSGEWKEDYEADEAGQVPSDLKRGVLSEDGLYNLLHDAEQIIAHVKEVFDEK